MCRLQSDTDTHSEMATKRGTVSKVENLLSGGLEAGVDVTVTIHHVHII